MLVRRALLPLVLFVLAAVPAGAQVTINVDAAVNRRAIDSRIYGVAFADSASITDLGIPLNRWGGNTTSRYNWGNSTANHAVDFYFENIPDTAPNGGSNGESADLFIQPTLTAGAQPIMTIPVLGYLPSSRTKACGFSIARYSGAGCCYSNDAQFMPDCGDGFHTVTHAALKGVNAPLDIETVYPSSYQGLWIQHNITTFGSAATTGVKYYAIDNEPGLWDPTHFDIHPSYSTYDEIWGKTQEYGAVIKGNDGGSAVLGPEEWGWLSYFDSAVDYRNSSTADRTAHGSIPFIDWLLQQEHAYQQTHGTRIVDALTLHYYPQGSLATGAQELDSSNPAEETTTAAKQLRAQSTRSLWDPTYVEQSWIQNVPAPGEASAIVRLIPRMHDWVNKNYPGTKIGVTEYNWGAEADPSGATAQADILGIFGREGLDLATRWTSPASGSNVYKAYKMYRNYDGAHSEFGDISVSATGPNPDTVSTFAALRSSDRALTIMVINKDLSTTIPVTVNIANYTASGGADLWQLTAANTIVSGGTIPAMPIVFNAPPETVTLFVVPGTYLDAPAGVAAGATSASTVKVTWNLVAGASSYQVYRSATVTGPFVPVGPTTAMTSYNDGPLNADTTYLYRVVAMSASLTSGYSAIDPATTTMFTDDPLTAGTIVRSVHLTQLRTAVNAMRTAAGLGAQPFTDDPLPSGTTIKSVHFQELRSALDQARAVIGVPVATYTDTALTPAATPVRGVHINELRNGVK